VCVCVREREREREKEREGEGERETTGTLISFQQGKEGDVFGELRQRLKDGGGACR
jgi:hypothetical protein